jgi:hypothetical protein
MKKILTIERTYHEHGTNGEIRLDNGRISFCIELPWKNNQRNVSCIPEGVYRLKKHTRSSGYRKSILVEGVQGRSGILFHPANYALKELRGCIAPVSELDSPGIGWSSRKAMNQLIQEVYSALNEGEVYLKIIEKGKDPMKTEKEIEDLNLIERLKAPTPKLFKKLKRIGLTVATVGGILATAPVSLPAGLVTLAGYASVAGGVLGATSMAAVDEKGLKGLWKKVKGGEYPWK